MKPLPTPTLALVDSEVAEIVRFFNLSTNNGNNLGGAGSPQQRSINDGNKVSFREVVDALAEGLPQEGTNRTLYEAVTKTRDYMMFLSETWKMMADTSGFEPTFDEIVSKEQLESVLDFIDQDKNGTLELNELLDAFRVSKRFR